MPDKFVKVAQVQPGQVFRYGGVMYARATEQEIARHPAGELPRHKGPLVLAYGLDNIKRTPVAFSEDAQIMVELI